jgi:hypothetical protein
MSTTGSSPEISRKLNLVPKISKSGSIKQISNYYTSSNDYGKNKHPELSVITYATNYACATYNVIAFF